MPAVALLSITVSWFRADCRGSLGCESEYAEADERVIRKFGKGPIVVTRSTHNGKGQSANMTLPHLRHMADYFQSFPRDGVNLAMVCRCMG
ncbi:uncharacterized protein BCR38DRAFT_443522, partial [Pseudomassariella vexata]